LHLKGKLRGCIGHIESVDPVWRVVKDVAAKSAFHDPRFPPLRAEELKQIDVEISLLSPLAEIRDIGEIEVGVHGLLLELGNHRGLLLPQVATEHGWTREEFLDHTAWKAGLKPEAWKDPRASIHIFTAEIIEESHVAAQ
jgi:AmmeMemoRadiSam system protein A